MPASTFAPTCALLGGSLWIVHWLVGPADDPLGQTLSWVGLSFMLLAAAVAAADLVTRDVLPLRILVTVAAPLLVWSVIEFFRPEEAGWYVGAWGVVAVVAGMGRLWQHRDSLVPAPPASRRAPARRAQPRGAHARGAHAR